MPSSSKKKKERKKNNPSCLSLSLSLSQIFTDLSITVPEVFPPRFDTSAERVGCTSELLNPSRCLPPPTPVPPNWKTAREHQEATCQHWSFPSALQPPPVASERIRQRAGFVDEKKSTNCLIIQISTIMNRYSTVREHGVQPELPPQHSSCESWLLISEWLSGINNPGTPFKFPSCVLTVCTCNCRIAHKGTVDRHATEGTN